MAIEYHYFKTPEKRELPEKESPQKFHPRVVKAKLITTEQLANRISRGHSFTPADVKGVLRAFRDELMEELMNGNNVNWENFGTFFVSLTAAPITDPKQMTPMNVRIKKIHFNPGKEIKKELRRAKLIRADQYSEATEKMTAEERKKNLLAFLRRYGQGQNAHFSRINGCSRTTTFRDLKELEKEGHIRKIGKSGSSFYVLPENPVS